MPQFRVGVRVDADAKGFRRTMRRAGDETRRLGRRLSGTGREGRSAAGALDRSAAGAGRLDRRARGASQRVGTLARRLREAARGSRELSSGMRSAGSGAMRLGGMALGGFAATAALGGVVSFEERIARLGIAAHIPREEAQRLGRAVFSTANRDDVRLDPSQLLDAVEAQLERGSPVSEVEADLLNVARWTQASDRTQGRNVGLMNSEFRKMGIAAGAEREAMADILSQQSVQGSFLQRDMARLGPRIMSAGVRMGYEGIGDTTELGAWLQTLQDQIGNPEMVVTATEAMVRSMRDAGVQEELRSQLGVEVRDPATGELRLLGDIARDIAAAAGTEEGVSGILDSEVMRGLSAFFSAANAAKYERLRGMQHDPASEFSVAAKSRIAAETVQAQTQAARGGLQELLQEHLEGPLGTAAATLTAWSSEIAAAAGTAILGGYAFRGARAGRDMYRRFRGARGTAAPPPDGRIGARPGVPPDDGTREAQPKPKAKEAGLGARPGVPPDDGTREAQPKPKAKEAGLGARPGVPPDDGTREAQPKPKAKEAGLGARPGVPPDDGTREAQPKPKAKEAGLGARSGKSSGDEIRQPGRRRLGRRGRVGAALGLAALAGGAAADGPVLREAAGIVGSMAGGWGGAKLGAALGTMVAPGIGTLVGGAVGGLAGALAGDAAGSALLGGGSDAPAGEGLPPDALGGRDLDSLSVRQLLAEELEIARQDRPAPARGGVTIHGGIRIEVAGGDGDPEAVARAVMTEWERWLERSQEQAEATLVGDLSAWA